jgi:Zinc finger, C3HC4 type (RING finger)
MKQCLFFFFFCILNVHSLLACASTELRKAGPKIAAEQFGLNYCSICLSDPSNIWGNCGHLCMCEACARANLEYSSNHAVQVVCPICRAPITFYSMLERGKRCLVCKKNLASVGHDRCRRLVLCGDCQTITRKTCPGCQKRGGRQINLFLPSDKIETISPLPDFEEDPAMLEQHDDYMDEST